MIGAALRRIRFGPEHVFMGIVILYPISILLYGLSLDAKRAWRPGPAGEARVIDGDTLVVDGIQVKLARIDAPETDQVCQDATGADYPCGQEATQELRNFIAGRPVECRQRTIDERLVSECSAGEIDLADAMLRTGHAITAGFPAVPGHGGAVLASYKDRDQICCRGFESQARERGVGLWQGRFVNPADWREGVR